MGNNSKRLKTENESDADWTKGRDEINGPLSRSAKRRKSRWEKSRRLNVEEKIFLKGSPQPGQQDLQLPQGQSKTPQNFKHLAKDSAGESSHAECIRGSLRSSRKSKLLAKQKLEALKTLEQEEEQEIREQAEALPSVEEDDLRNWKRSNGRHVPRTSLLHTVNTKDAETNRGELGSQELVFTKSPRRVSEAQRNSSPKDMVEHVGRQVIIIDSDTSDSESSTGPAEERAATLKRESYISRGRVTATKESRRRVDAMQQQSGDIFSSSSLSGPSSLTRPLRPQGEGLDQIRPGKQPRRRVSKRKEPVVREGASYNIVVAEAGRDRSGGKEARVPRLTMDETTMLLTSLTEYTEACAGFYEEVDILVRVGKEFRTLTEIDLSVAEIQRIQAKILDDKARDGDRVKDAEWNNGALQVMHSAITKWAAVKGREERRAMLRGQVRQEKALREQNEDSPSQQHSETLIRRSLREMQTRLDRRIEDVTEKIKMQQTELFQKLGESFQSFVVQHHDDMNRIGTQLRTLAGDTDEDSDGSDD